MSNFIFNETEDVFGKVDDVAVFDKASYLKEQKIDNPQNKILLIFCNLWP